MNVIKRGEKKDAILKRLKRVEGQVRAVHRMVEAEDECEKVIQQLAASRKALDKVFYEMIGCLIQQELPEDMMEDADVQEGVGKVSGMLCKYA